jgi:hypothetical protein
LKTLSFLPKTAQIAQSSAEVGLAGRSSELLVACKVEIKKPDQYVIAAVELEPSQNMKVIQSECCDNAIIRFARESQISNLPHCWHG